MQRKFILIALLAAQLAAAQSTVITRSTVLTRTTKLGLSLAFTFSLVQEHNCTITSGVNSCTFSVSPNLATGNLDVYKCVAQDSAATTPPRISSITNSAGTLVQDVGATIGDQGVLGGANSRHFGAYILPSTSTGGAGNPVITFTLTPDFGGYCYMAELHPSGTGSSVALDIDGTYIPSASCSSCAGNNWTDTGTNDACVVAQMGTGAFNLYPTAVSSPYNTNAFFSSSALSAGFSVAITGSGTAPTWTQTSGIPALSTQCFGWSPSTGVWQSFVDFEGVNGNQPTASTLAAETHGQQGGTWIPTTTANMVYGATNMPLQANTGKLYGDGTNYSSGAGSHGITLTGSGGAITNNVLYNVGYTKLASVTTSVWFCSDVSQADTSDNDMFAIQGTGGSSDSAGALFEGTGTRFFVLEALSGNAPGSIAYASGTGCGAGGTGWVNIQIQYNFSGNHNLLVCNTTGAQVGSTLTQASEGNAYMDRVVIGNLSAQTLTNGAHYYWDSLKIDYTGKFGCGTLLQ